MSADENLMRVHDIAYQLALGELVRFMLGEMVFDKDPAVFSDRLRRIEDVLIANLSGRRLYESANESTESMIKESACGYITRLLSSIRHPDDRRA